MNRIDAAVLIREAAFRLDAPSKNYHGGPFHAGGAYWRLANVLEHFLEPILPSVEGRDRADFLLETHGRIAREKPMFATPQSTRRVISIVEARELTDLIVKATVHETSPDRLRKIVLPLIMSATKSQSLSEEAAAS